MSEDWEDIFEERDLPGAAVVLEGTYEETDMTLYGVSHSPQFLDYYRKDFLDKVPESDAWVFESGGVSLQGGGLDGDFRDMEFMDEVSQMIVDRPGVAFEVDPTGPGLVTIDGAALGGGMLAAHDGIEGLKRSKDREISRRDLLKEGTKTAAGGYLLATNTFGVLLRNLVGGLINGQNNHVDTYGRDDDLSINAFDYRNREIAEGLRKIATETEYNDLVAVHGRAHCRPVAHYLVEGTDDFKENFYSPADYIDSDISKFIGKNGNWEEQENPF